MKKGKSCKQKVVSIALCLVMLVGTSTVSVSAVENEAQLQSAAEPAMGTVYAQSAVSGPYEIILSYTKDPKICMTVTWHDKEQSSAAFVNYSTSADMSSAKQVKASNVKIASEIPMSDYIYSAEMTGLVPGTEYFYTVKTKTQVSSVQSFTTAPQTPAATAAGTSPEASYTFMYMGDIQVQSDAQAEYAQWGQLLQNAYRRNPDIAFGLFGGDIVESGINVNQFNYFLENAQPVFSQIPMLSTNGNHESNFAETGKPELYLDMFSLPQNGPEGYKEEFYSFDYSTTHVMVLNSWVFSGEQKVSDSDYARIKKWIKDDLAGSSAKFKIVLMHHPVYALAADDVCEKVKTEWEPVFEAGGVDLVFCGHQHVYSRSYPMKSGAIDYENGITYVMGYAGAKAYSAADETWQERSVYNTSNYQIIRINGNELTLESYDASGSELDFWTMQSKASQSTAGSTGQNSSGNGSAAYMKKFAIGITDFWKYLYKIRQ